MKKLFATLMMGLVLLTPASAEECITPKFAEKFITSVNPNVTIEEREIVNGTGHILYSSPDRNEKLLHTFLNGCRIYAGPPGISTEPGEGA
jgi:hypothetical protein